MLWYKFFLLYFIISYSKLDMKESKNQTGLKSNYTNNYTTATTCKWNQSSPKFCIVLITCSGFWRPSQLTTVAAGFRSHLTLLWQAISFPRSLSHALHGKYIRDWYRDYVFNGVIMTWRWWWWWWWLCITTDSFHYVYFTEENWKARILLGSTLQ